MMEQNHPTFFITFWAIVKIGAIPSLINTNLSEDALLHCLAITNASIFLFDPIYESQVATIVDRVHEAGMELFAYGESTEFNNATTSSLARTLTPNVLSNYPDKDTDERLIRGVKLSEPGILIYTRYKV